MGDTNQNEEVTVSTDSIQVTNTAMSGAVPPPPTIETKDVPKSKENEMEGSIHIDDSPTLQETVPPEESQPKDSPDDQTERVQTTTETEYETTEGGTRKHVKSSVTEMKEFSHKVHRTVYNDSPDSTSANVSEFSEVPRVKGRVPVKTYVDYSPKLPRTPVVSTVKVPSQRPVFIERTIETNRPVDPRLTSMAGGSSSGPTGTAASGFVPLQFHEEMKRSYERELAELKNVQTTSSTTESKMESKEEMTRHIIQLESDLRDSKNMSTVLGEEIKNSRKKFEQMLNKTVQMENQLRATQEKLKDYKTKNKQLLRATQDREAIREKLREAHKEVKRMEMYVEKVEDERNMLVKDYEILRQSHNRKDQQLQGYNTDRAELLRRLDMLEFDKRQLEYQLMEAKRRERSNKYRSGGMSPRRQHRSHTQRDSITGTPIRLSSLPPGLQVDIPTPENRPVDLGGRPNGAVETGEKQQSGWTQEVGAQLSTSVARGEAEDDQTLRDSITAGAAENAASPMGNADTLTVDPSSKLVSAASPADTLHGAESPSRGQNEGGVEERPEQHSSPPVGSPELRSDHRRHDRPGRLALERDGQGQSPTDSQEDEIVGPYMHTSMYIPQLYDDGRHLSSKSYHVKRRTIRRPPEYDLSRAEDYRGDSYLRSSRYRRPTSAYGYVSSRHVTRDIDVFPSPIPLRSATSMGRNVYVEHVRSPDREYSRMHRSPIRRSHKVYTPYTTTTMSPDPFLYEPVRTPRAELSHLESQLDSLKREKRRLERQYNATQTASSLTDNLRRREELLNAIVQLGVNIRHLQSRLNYLR